MPLPLYADAPSRRARQIAGDASAAAWTIVWIRIGLHVHDLVDRLRSPADQVQGAGSRLAADLSDVASGIGRVPVAGGTLKSPFQSAANASQGLGDAGQRASSDIHALAMWIGFVAAVLPIAWLLARYLPGRIRWMREAAAARRVLARPDALRLFAHRAVVRCSLSELASASDDPEGDLRSGRYTALAALELGRLGLSVSETSPEPVMG